MLLGHVMRQLCALDMESASINNFVLMKSANTYANVRPNTLAKTANGEILKIKSL